MTAAQELTCALTLHGRHTARLAVVGDLEYGSAARLVDTVAQGLAEHPGLRALHVDCSGIGFCDSYGLAQLLMVHRHLAAAGVVLHLDDRPAALDRLLQVTSTLAHLTAPPGLEQSSDTSD
jgi:anti-anti-sigma factor